MDRKKDASPDFVSGQIYRLIEIFKIDPEDIFCKNLKDRILANEFKEEILVKTIDYVIDHVEPNWLSIASVMKAKQIIEEYEANKFRLHPALCAGD